jgi:uncharacterized protein YndB with AHSA1/START domain
MTSARMGEVSIGIEAPPETVWDLLADVERMGEWSPECYQVRWLDGATSPAQPGARFKGSNRSGRWKWSMTCAIQTAKRPEEISWSTVRGGKEIVRWTYRLQRGERGTEVTESFQAISWPLDVRFFEDVVFRHRNEDREAAMVTTLQRIKATAEKALSMEGDTTGGSERSTGLQQ